DMGCYPGLGDSPSREPSSQIKSCKGVMHFIIPPFRQTQALGPALLPTTRKHCNEGVVAKRFLLSATFQQPFNRFMLAGTGDDQAGPKRVRRGGSPVGFCSGGPIISS